MYCNFNSNTDETFADFTFDIRTYKEKLFGGIYIECAANDKGKNVGFALEIKKNMTGISDNNISGTWHTYPDGIKILFINYLSDDLLKRICKHYEIKWLNYKLRDISIIECGSLTQNPLNYNEKIIKFKCFIDSSNTNNMYAEFYINIDLQNKKVYLKEKDTKYRENIVKYLSKKNIMDNETFKEIVKRELLKSGFKFICKKYFLTTDDVIIRIEFQKSDYGDYYYINCDYFLNELYSNEKYPELAKKWSPTQQRFLCYDKKLNQMTPMFEPEKLDEKILVMSIQENINTIINKIIDNGFKEYAKQELLYDIIGLKERELLNLKKPTEKEYRINHIKYKNNNKRICKKFKKMLKDSDNIQQENN